MSKKKQKKSSNSTLKFMKKFLQRKTALVSLIILLLVIFLAIFERIICPYDPVETNTKARLLGPSLQHFFGTDKLGRDELARVLDGSRISLIISLASVMFAMVIGTAVGTISGYVGGILDRILSLIIDSICAFPTVLLGLILATVLGPGLLNITIAIGIANIPYFARLVRSMAISIREREYVQSAIVTGLSHFEIIIKYVLPNMLSVIIVQISLSAASAIITESTLSFMGVGVQPPAASWGASTDWMSCGASPWMRTARCA